MRFALNLLISRRRAFLTTVAAGVLMLRPGPAAARPDLVAVSPYTSYSAACTTRIGQVALSPSAARIAFVHCYDPLLKNPGAVPQLFIQRVDGGGLFQVTGNGVTEPETPVWNVEGSLLYFTALVDSPQRRELFSVPAPGGTPTRLTFQAGTSGFRDIANPSPITGGVWFSTGADLLGEGLTIRSDEKNFYRLVGSTLTRITDVNTHPMRNAVLFGASADGSVAAFAGSDPNLPGSRPLRPYKLVTASGAVTPLTPDEIGAAGIAGQFSAIGGKLVFQAAADYTGMNGGRNNQLFSVSTGGGAVEQMTDINSPGPSAPSTDGQGNLVTFETTTSILIGESTGKSRVYTIKDGQTRRISSGRSASVSLDGMRIAYVDEADSTGGNPDLSPEIYSVRTDGTDRRQHTGFAAGSSSQPDVSTTGDWIAFRSTANLDGGNPAARSQIYVVHGDGTGLRRLTSVPAGREAREPSLSAGGDFVVFSSNADLVTNQNFDNNYEIFRVRTDGTAMTQISQSSSGANAHPLVSAGGDTVTFISTANVVVGASMGSGRVAVWRKNGGTSLVTPTSDRPIDSIRMSDNGTRIAVLTEANLDNRNPTHSRLPFTVNVSGSGLIPVQLSGPLQPGGLGLSPDGRQLVVAFLDGKLALVPYTGGTPDTVFADPGAFATLPVVSNEGQYVAFSVLTNSASFRRGDTFRVNRTNGEVTAMIEAVQPLAPETPAMSGDGNRLAFGISSADTLNPDGSREILSVLFAPTPVRLLDFSAERANGKIRLSWRVSDDEEAAAWLIDRSVGNLEFERMAGLSLPGSSHTWWDNTAPPGEIRYRLSAVDRTGTTEVLGIISARGSVPIGPRLSVSPNPMNPNTTVSFTLPAPEKVALRIVDVTGRLVRTLFDATAPAGRTELAWDGTNDLGERIGSGVYYVALNGKSAVSIILAR